MLDGITYIATLLLAVIAMKFSLVGVVPKLSYLTTLDKMFVWSYMYIFLCFIAYIDEKSDPNANFVEIILGSVENLFFNISKSLRSVLTHNQPNLTTDILNFFSANVICLSFIGACYLPIKDKRTSIYIAVCFRIAMVFIISINFWFLYRQVKVYFDARYRGKKYYMNFSCPEMII